MQLFLLSLGYNPHLTIIIHRGWPASLAAFPPWRPLPGTVSRHRQPGAATAAASEAARIRATWKAVRWNAVRRTRRWGRWRSRETCASSDAASCYPAQGSVDK